MKFSSWNFCNSISRLEIEVWASGRWRDGFLGACFIERQEMNGKKMKMKLLSRQFQYEKSSDLTGFMELKAEFV
jgi:hypothetical protein